MLVGADVPYRSVNLVGPWRSSSDWILADGIDLVMAYAGDETAFVVARETDLPDGARWHVLGALSIGRLGLATVDGNCAVGGVDDPWVFGEMEQGYRCADHPMPVAHAWRASADGTICPIAVHGVMCGESTCD